MQTMMLAMGCLQWDDADAHNGAGNDVQIMIPTLDSTVQHRIGVTFDYVYEVKQSQMIFEYGNNKLTNCYNFCIANQMILKSCNHNNVPCDRK